MPEERYITIVSERKTIALRVSTILYVLMNGKYANIHVLGDQVYRTTMTLGEIEEKIGDGFCGCIAAALWLSWQFITSRIPSISVMGNPWGIRPVRRGNHENTPECPAGRVAFVQLALRRADGLHCGRGADTAGGAVQCGGTQAVFTEAGNTEHVLAAG